jgi:peroxiredoxin
MIEVGKPAPDFELVSHLGGTKFSLSQFKGQKNVMLVFYPFGLDTDLKQRDSWTRSSKERVQGL